MTDASDAPEAPSAPAGSTPPVLEYATPRTGGLVEIARYSSSAEAELCAAVLQQEGITSKLLNANMNALNYGGIAEVELHVGAQDADRAVAILKRATLDALEPAEEPADPPTIHDEDGRQLHLAPVAAFDSVRLMRDAQTILLSERIKSYPPQLVARGDRPPGQGPRFILRVRSDEVATASKILSDAASEDDDPRCPRCQSWQVRPLTQFWKCLAAAIQLNDQPPAQIECTICGKRGPREEFLRARGTQAH